MEGTFFGEYVAPVEDFSRGLYQPTLDSAFKRGSQPLPFHLVIIEYTQAALYVVWKGNVEF